MLLTLTIVIIVQDVCSRIYKEGGLVYKIQFNYYSLFSALASSLIADLGALAAAFYISFLAASL